MTQLSRFYILASCTLLCACASTNSSSPAISLFNDPSNTFKPGNRDDQLAIQNDVKALNPYVGYKHALKAATDYYQVTSQNTDTKKENTDTKKENTDTNKGNTLNQNLLREGMSIIEYRCGVYFDELGKALQMLSFQRKETSLIGGLIQGSMGLANQSSKAIANTGAVFGFATSSMDAYQEAFLYTPDIDFIRRLVLNAMQNSATQISESIGDKSLNYGAVISYLKQYESNCQPASIRALVNQSIINAVDNKENKDNGQFTVAMAGLVNALGLSSLTNEQAFGLYWLQSPKYEAASDESALTNLLKGLDFVFKDKKLNPGALKAKQNSAFVFFPKETLESWDARIDAIHKEKSATPSTSATNSVSAPAPAKPNGTDDIKNYGANRWFGYGTVAPTFNIIKK